MLVLKKILKDNYISITSISLFLGLSHSSFSLKLNKSRDFTIIELEKIKSYLIYHGCIDNNFDIGCFLNEL